MPAGQLRSFPPGRLKGLSTDGRVFKTQPAAEFSADGQTTHSGAAGTLGGGLQETLGLYSPATALRAYTASIRISAPKASALGTSSTAGLSPAAFTPMP